MNPNGESDVCSVSKYGCWPRQNWLMKEAFVCLLLHWPLRDGRAFNKSPKPGNGLRLALKVWEFWEKNWRKGGLSERRKILLAENGFYNQQYCGCEFSFRKPPK